MSKLLISEPPLQVLPTLARLIGLNEAIVLQQVHYYSLRSRDEGWVERAITDWHREDFFFWGIATVKRAFAALEARWLLETQVMVTAKGRQAKVRVNHEALDRLAGGSDQIDTTQSDQCAPTRRINVSRRHTLKGEKKTLRVGVDKSTPTQEPPRPPRGGRARDRATYLDQLKAWILEAFGPDHLDGRVKAIDQALRMTDARTVDELRDFVMTWFPQYATEAAA